jgi:hypothetical protein
MVDPVSSSKLYLQGEIRLDRGPVIPVKRHYAYAWSDGARAATTSADGFTVFVAADSPAAEVGDEGVLTLLRTMTRERMRVEVVNKIGTEVRIVGRRLGPAPAPT